jgi:hypothetical protein
MSNSPVAIAYLDFFILFSIRILQYSTKKTACKHCASFVRPEKARIPSDFGERVHRYAHFSGRSSFMVGQRENAFPCAVLYKNICFPTFFDAHKKNEWHNAHGKAYVIYY